jgi:AraC-like DNA-binding protein
MLFETEGISFSKFVLGQRLMRAHRMLSDPRCAGLSVSAIAFAVGFGDLSYFHRSFRRHYGESPAAVRAQAAQRPDELEGLLTEQDHSLSSQVSPVSRLPNSSWSALLTSRKPVCS